MLCRMAGGELAKAFEDLKDQPVTVVGAARTGIAAARLLAGRRARVTLTDARSMADLEWDAEVLRQLAGVRLELGGHHRETFLESRLLVVSPGVPDDQELLVAARLQGIPVVDENEMVYHLTGMPIVAVTGTNGKSTTTTLVGEILKKSSLKPFVGGNLGTPLSQALLDPDAYRILVAEVSSFQLERTFDFRPWIAVVTNLAPDHLDRHPDLETYARCKKKIFARQEAEDFLVVNGDDPEVCSWQGRSKVFRFSRSPLAEGVWVQGGRIEALLPTFRGALMPLSEVALEGVHNLENVLAASAAALLCGASPEAVRAAVAGAKGLEHRMEFVRQVHGVRYINDSKGTNVGATVKSLESFSCPVHLIAGGKGKGTDFRPLGPLVAKVVKTLILIGQAADAMAEALGGLTETCRARDLKEAVALAAARSRPGEVVLLSPACASFDMFRNFEERGKAFKEAVIALPWEDL